MKARDGCGDGSDEGSQTAAADLNRLARLATTAPPRHREQIERIIHTAQEADDTARQTAVIMKRMNNGPG